MWARSIGPYRRWVILFINIIVHIADLSAWEGHRRTMGRSIGGAPMNCAPTGYDRYCLLKFIIGGGRDQSAPTTRHSGRRSECITFHYSLGNLVNSHSHISFEDI